MPCDCIKELLVNTKDNDVCFSEGTTAEERGKKFSIDKSNCQNEKICKIKVDNCLITSMTENKCDFAFYRSKKNEYYFVELKSVDIKHAAKQIVETKNYFRNKINNGTFLNDNIKCFIILRKSPAVGSKERREIEKIFASEKIFIKTSSIQYTHKILP
jgi:hypothetical protein